MGGGHQSHAAVSARHVSAGIGATAMKKSICP
jgi:hypothetical protein